MKVINSKAVLVFQDVCQAGKGAVLAGSACFYLTVLLRCPGDDRKNLGNAILPSLKRD